MASPKPFVVSYDLDKPGQNYGRIDKALRDLGATRILFSQWALKSVYTATQLMEHLKGYIDTNDRLLVTEISDWASYNLMVKISDVVKAA